MKFSKKTDFCPFLSDFHTTRFVGSVKYREPLKKAIPNGVDPASMSPNTGRGREGAREGEMEGWREGWSE